MSGRVELLSLLRKVRRRLRARAVVQGVMLGCCGFLATAALLLAIDRLQGRAPGHHAFFWMLVPWVLAGAAAAAARRIPLARCARTIDRTVGRAGEAGNGDRTFTALALLEQAEPLTPTLSPADRGEGVGVGARGEPLTPTLSPADRGEGVGDGGDGFVAAAVADAMRAAGGMRLEVVVPWRVPRGLGVAGGLMAITLVLSLWPVRGAPAAQVRRAGEGARTGKPLDPALFTLDRRAADEAARRAAALADDTLARLASELRRVLAGLESGTVDRGEALERLGRLAEQAATAAREGSAVAHGLRAAGDALAGDAAAAALASALRALDEQVSGKAAQELAARAETLGGKQRQGLAEALGKAAAAEAQAGGDTGAGGSNQRRLSSPEAGRAGENAASRSNERQLKSLERALKNGAEACRESPEACKRALGQAGASLPPLAREGQRSSSRDRLGRAVEQLRERLRRMNPDDRAGRVAEQEFERAVGAGGEPSPGGEGEGAVQGATPGESGAGSPGQEGLAAEPAGGESTGGAASAAAAGAEGGSASGGDGVGHDPGTDPLGAREPGNGSPRGEAHQARVRSGAGPSRAEVIEAGARRGFARTEYHQVFDDYSAVVEETLDTTAVPPARRYLVRRYFKLIRPRTGAPERGARP